MTQVTGAGGVWPPIAAQDLPEAKELNELFSSVQNLVTEMKGTEGPTLKGTPSAPSKPVLEAPQTDQDSLALLLMNLRGKIGELQIRTSKEEIQNNLTKKKDLHQQRLAKIQEFIDKLKEAKALGIFGKIFGWIAAIALAVVAVATANPALIAAAVITVATTAMQEMGLDNPIILGLSKMLQAFGMDEQTAQLVAGIAFAVAMAAVCIGGAAAVGATAASNTAQIVRAAAQITGGVAMVGSGATGIAQAKYAHDAQQAKADSLDFQALIKKLQSMMEDEMDRLQEIIQQLQEGMSIVLQMLSSSDETMRAMFKPRVQV